MKESDIKNVVDIMFEADSGCPVCVYNLLEKLVKVYPKHYDLINSLWHERFDYDAYNKTSDLELS